MKYVDIESLEERKEELSRIWHSGKPFKHLHFDNFFKPEMAELIHEHYPGVGSSSWDHTTYINQKNKFTKTDFSDNAVLDEVFQELNCERMRQWLTDLTGIDQLRPDEQLFGAGLHQSTKGAFLDVHVDFNIHPATKEHRRMNMLVYMNKDWKDEYEGHLQLWDMDTKTEIGRIAPVFNRCAMFETNEISFHGHPAPLACPEGMSRKSLSVYYYTEARDDIEIADEHNTIYVNTEGGKGKIKNIKSGMKALVERITK